jgi:SWI/SNF-related matrix-associated actin-dependent regulator 1 of chromatin subfamily A
VGLTLSTKVRGQGGERVWFTKTPYAALPYYRQGNAAAQAQLAGLWRDYEDSWATDSDLSVPAPPGREYMPFQRAGIAYALRHERCLIGDEPGLGKTVEAIGTANALGAEKILVICPASIRLNWQREIRDWSILPRVTTLTQPVLKSSRGINPYTNYTIVSYELARNEGIHNALMGINWDLLVLDEAHYLKTPDAQRTRAVFGGGTKNFKVNWLADRSKHILGLTGTPLPNRPRECYTLARGLCWESIDWTSYDAFQHRFNPSQQMYSGAIREEKGRLPELQSRLRCNFMVRRLKEDVLKDLPDKRYEFTYVEPNGDIKEVLAREKLLNFEIEDLLSPFGDIAGQISTVRREMGEAKVPRIIEHMQYLLDIVEIPKVVMFAHHRGVMDSLHAALDHYGLVTVRGGMSTHAKQHSIDEFVLNPDIRVFSGQLDAAGFGIDGLQKVASHVVFAEPAWTPGTNEQAVDRCHRHGQHDNVVAQFLIVEDSLDEYVLRAVIDKVKTVHESLDRR